MKIVLYIILGLVVIGAVFIAMAYFMLQVPKIEIPKGASQAEKMEYIDQWFVELQAKGKFNGGVLMVKDGKPQLMKAYGYTDYSRKVALNPQSSFRLASVSKQFTAVGIMLLKEKGQLDYDHEVMTYLKHFPYQGVTIRHLLNQTSGVPDSYMPLAKQYRPEVGDTLSIKEAVRLVCTYPKKAKYLPNQKYEYSNTNYILLAAIIEEISDQSFEAFMQEQLFDPLGMKNTRVWNLLSVESTFPNKTNGFEQLRKAKAVAPSWLDGVAGDGAVFSSMEDFLIWDQFWYENDLISPENLKEAFKMPRLNDGSLSDYGFGWIIEKDVVWHNGAWLATNSFIIRNTAEKTCTVIVDNSSNLGFENILGQLRNLKNVAK